RTTIEPGIRGLITRPSVLDPASDGVIPRVSYVAPDARLVTPRTAFDRKRTSCARGGRQPSVRERISGWSGELAGGRAHANPRLSCGEEENQMSKLRMRLSRVSVR